jgi:hypothetical protein
MQYLLAVLAYVLPTFPLGYFWHLSTFKPQYDELEIYRPDILIPMGLGSMVLQGLFFAWVFPRLFAGLPWPTAAFQFFAIFGILAWSFVVLPVAAKYRMSSVSRFVALETVFTAIQFAIAGVLLALVFNA